MHLTFFLLAKSVKYIGCIYKLGDFILINDDLAANIKNIYISREDDIVFIKFDRIELIYEENLCAYRILNTLNDDIKIITDFTNPPVNAHNVLRETFLVNKFMN